ncbi:MAG TPA: VWA domain-containing protein [Bacillota bacterium]
MVLEFGNPAWLALLLLLGPTVALWRPNPWFWSRARHRLVLGLRAAILVALVLALAGTQWRQAIKSQTVVFVVDVSDSVGKSKEAAEDFIRKALAAKGPDDRAAVVAVGREGMVDLPVDATIDFNRVETRPDPHFTDLAAGIRLAEALYPRDSLKRIVLISDGRQNLEDVVEEAKTLSNRGIRLDVVPLDPGQGPEVLVDQVSGPASAHQGERVDLVVKVDSNVATSAILRLFRDRTLLSEETVAVAKGESRLVLSVPPMEVGLHSLTVNLDPRDDTVLINNQGSILVNVAGPPEVLVVEGKDGEGANLARALTSRGIKTTLRAASAIPTTLAELRQYSSLVLVDVPATALGPKPMEMIRAYVRDLGQGLVMVGGPDAYGPGGYFKTPVEEALPVNMDLRSRAELPSLGLVLVIDKSGSMSEGAGGFTKVDLAKEAAARATEILSAKDQIGVVAFDDTAKWVVKLQPPTDLGAIQDDIGTIRAGGGTDIFPAVSLAYEALAKASTKLKHIILLTDGMSGAGGDYDQLTRKMAEQKITLSTVAVGSDADVNFLLTLARMGEGRNYVTDDLPSIPKIFTKETILATRSYLVEGRFTPAVTGDSAALRGLAGLPPLDGYVATSAKETAEVPLVSQKDDPVLAQWQYGLGRSAAWTSDVNGQWSSSWVSWNEFARFWSNLVAWTLPQQDEGILRLETSVAGGEGRIIAETPLELTRTRPSKATVVDPDLVAHQVDLIPVSPGRYEARFDASAPGVYLVQATQQEGGKVAAAAMSGVAVPYSPEYRPSPVDPGFLSRLASAAGGASLQRPEEAFSHNLPKDRGRVDAWPWLLGLAALLMPFDVAARRVFVSKADLQAIWSTVAGRRRIVAARIEASTPTLERLRRRKELADSVLPARSEVRPGPAAPLGSTRPAGGPPPRTMAAKDIPSKGALAEPQTAAGDLTDRLLEAKRRGRQK